MYSIYCLKDPRTNQIRYVGMTGENPYVRLGAHISGVFSGSLSRNNKKKRWIRDLVEKGLLPKLQILETTNTSKSALKLESSWIKQFKKDGVDLVNMINRPNTYNGRKKRIEFQFQDILLNDKEGGYSIVMPGDEMLWGAIFEIASDMRIALENDRPLFFIAYDPISIENYIAATAYDHLPFVDSIEKVLYEKKVVTNR